MTELFISYARADGTQAAVRLRGELESMGVTVWRDSEDMRGGKAWKEQLRAVLRQVDVVVVLLTPGAVTSKMVEWEWENALTLEKRVIAVLVETCQVPEELSRLHYHDLSDSATYTLSLMKLVRDINEVAAEKGVAQPAAADPAAKYIVHKAKQSAIGDNAKAVNIGTEAQKASEALKKHSGHSVDE